MSAGQIARAQDVELRLVPYPKRADWFAIPPAWLPAIASAPAVQLDQCYGPIVHRTHLPILAKLYSQAALFLDGLRSQVGLPDDPIVDQRHRDFDATTEPYGWKLRPYQHAGRDFIRARRGTLLADSPRVGKSAQCVASHDPDSGPMVVVAPLATREVWLSWFRRRWPDIRPTVLQGKQPIFVNAKAPRASKRDRGYDVIEAESYDPDQLKAAKLVFLHYDILAGWQNYGNIRIGTLVFDEVHVASRQRTKRSVGAQFISNNAERVIGATGTPVWNKPSGLYTMLSCMNPGAWGLRYDFLTRYCGGHPGLHGFEADGTSNEAEFQDRLSELMIRRTWESISGQLPAITRTVEVVEINERQAFEIEKEAERVRDHSHKSTAVGAMARFRRLIGRLKIPGAVDAALRVLQAEERVIVWVWHRDIALKIDDELTKAGYPGFVVTGSTPMDVRESIFDQWRKHPAAPLMISLSVGQVGIDLSAARQEVFAELDFTPVVVAQAEMRPFTATQPISAIYIILDHEIDRKIIEAIQTKCELADRLGIPAADSAIGVLASAFSGKGMFATAGDFNVDMLAAAILSDHPEEEDTSDYHGELWHHDWES